METLIEIDLTAGVEDARNDSATPDICSQWRVNNGVRNEVIDTVRDEPVDTSVSLSFTLS